MNPLSSTTVVLASSSFDFYLFLTVSVFVLLKVIGGSGLLYTCYTSCHYCSCPAFAYAVLRRNESLLCKHILAAYLSQAMGLSQQETLSDQQMSSILSGRAVRTDT
ncbi:unnamed protein product [Coregonus sp. 'balchen']|nr:unnamed protein product [Coregonus sp. 'balchen']